MRYRLREKAADLTALAAMLLIYAFFNRLLVNRFFPLTEGWFQDYAYYIRQGQVMYRDFHLFIPPGFPVLITILSHIFGDCLLAYRYYGILERLLLVALSFVLLRRLFSIRTVFISLLTSAFVYMSNMQDIFYGYYQTSLLLTVVMLLCCVRMYEQADQHSIRNAVLFGLSVGLTILFKHTTGVIIGFGLSVVYLILRGKDDISAAMRQIGIAIGAAAVVVGAACAALAAYGALGSCVQQLFGSADSKGGLGDVLFGFLPRLVSNGTVITAVFFIGFYCTGKRMKNRRGDCRRPGYAG